MKKKEIKVHLDSRVCADGNARVLLYYGHERVPTGIWARSEKNGIVHGENETRKNRALGSYITEIEDLMFSGMEFREAAERVIPGLKRRATKGLHERFEEFRDTKEGGTYGIYNSAYKCLVKYTDDVPLDKVTPKWLEAYDKAMEADGISTNTRSIRMRCLRAVYNYCIDQEYTSNYPFRRFSVRQEATRKRNISIEDVKRLRDYPCEEHQTKYRDMWMLMLYLIGINPVDLFALTHDSVRNGYITYTRAKTHKRYAIKVEPEAQELLDRYRGSEHLLSLADEWSYKNFLHRMNVELKKIGTYERKGLGGKKVFTPLFPELSAYWARHSWATIAFEVGIPVDVIGRCLGHSDETHRTTMIYVDVSQAKVDDANRRVLDALL